MPRYVKGKVTDAQYFPKTGEAMCRECGWEYAGEGSTAKRLARSHCIDTDHETFLNITEPIIYTRVEL